MTPEWLKERGRVADELEETEEMGLPPFSVNKIMRGQSRGKTGMFTKKVTSNKEQSAKYKHILKLKGPGTDASKTNKKIMQYLTPKKLVARVYILKGKELTPKDGNNSDPYLILKLGEKEIIDKNSLRPDCINAPFFTHYDFTVELPGVSTLKIQVWDDDGFDFPDLIGETLIDLEDRYFNK